MVRQENIETASTVTSIIPASTLNSDHNSTTIKPQNNQQEPISPELINLDISNTLQKAKNLANNQEPAITPQEAPKKVIDMIMAEANQLQKDKAQRVPDDCMSLEKQHEFLPVCERIPWPYQHLQFAQWMASIYGKEEHDAFEKRMEEKNSPPPKEVPKTGPVARSSNSNVKKQAQVQNKGRGKAPATKPYSQGYRMPWKMYFRWPKQ
ncbi:hypothetical protein O181_129145 [Austropuccinia psidii MF-1]|uniref:Uncharacterized protein n=1 Tax=Austropuccinia psidii MF-1 TaxID=1389203 RepID=A0A9Q3Q9P5_9BASI|nr:hypothetical protein [Austropuccinia psidii MF-1]